MPETEPDGDPSDLSSTSVDELGGAADIAADDAGASALGRNTGQTAGGEEGFGYRSPFQEQPQGEIAADDAGATAQVTQAVEGEDVED
jgi:hypothetical protein